MKKIDAKELVYCKECYREDFSVTRSDGIKVNKGITIFRCDGANFFPVERLQNGDGIANYNIEMLDYIRLIFDWENNNGPNDKLYEILASNMVSRLTHKETGEVIYGFFLYNSGMYNRFYEKEGYFYPYAKDGDYTRKYYNPIYYPAEGCTLSFVQSADGIPDQELITIVESHLVMGKVFFKALDEGKSSYSFFKEVKWWTKSEEMIEMQRTELQKRKLPFEEVSVLITDVIWDYESKDCVLKVKADLSERQLNYKEKRSYSGTYQVETDWDVRIGLFLKKIDDKNIEIGSYSILRPNMQGYADLLKGEKVNIFYVPLGIRMRQGEYYLQVGIDIPEIFVAPKTVSGRAFKGEFPERIIAEVKVQKVKY